MSLIFLASVNYFQSSCCNVHFLQATVNCSGCSTSSCNRRLSDFYIVANPLAVKQPSGFNKHLLNYQWHWAFFFSLCLSFFFCKVSLDCFYWVIFLFLFANFPYILWIEITCQFYMLQYIPLVMRLWAFYFLYVFFFMNRKFFLF